MDGQFGKNGLTVRCPQCDAVYGLRKDDSYLCIKCGWGRNIIYKGRREKK